MFGRGGMDPNQLEKMMKQMGIDIEEMSGVEEVVIKKKNKELVITNPEVQVTKAKGQKTYQVVGEAEEKEKESKSEPEISEDDIEMVMDQAGAGREEAEKTLKETDGDIAEAILNLEE